MPWSGPRLLELLLHEVSRYPGVVLLCCASHESYDTVVHSLAPQLLAAMRSVVAFPLPDAATRARLWAALLPEQPEEAQGGVTRGSTARSWRPRATASAPRPSPTASSRRAYK